jgi:hypothetical protein
MRVLSDLQGYVKRSIEADDYFSGAVSIPVLSEEKSDFASQIELKLTKSLGIAVIVSTPGVRGGERRDQIIASVVVQIAENPVLNQSARGTGKAAADVAFRVYAILRELAPEGWSQLYLPQGNFLELLSVDKGLVVYQVAMDTMTHLIAPEPFATKQPEQFSQQVSRVVDS